MADFRGFHHDKKCYGKDNHSANPALVDRLTKLCGMTGSVHDGEALAACRKANELLRSHRLTWADVLEPFAAESPESHAPESGDLLWCWPLRWSEAAAFCDRHRHRLTERDGNFIEVLTGYTACPTEAQCRWLKDVVGKLLAMGIVP